jgi:hypothetical protein
MFPASDELDAERELDEDHEDHDDSLSVARSWKRFSSALEGLQELDEDKEEHGRSFLREG